MFPGASRPFKALLQAHKKHLALALGVLEITTPRSFEDTYAQQCQKSRRSLNDCQVDLRGGPRV